MKVDTRSLSKGGELGPKRGVLLYVSFRKMGGWCWFCLRDAWVLLRIAAAWAGIVGKWQVLWVWEGHEEWLEGCGHVSRQQGGRWWLKEAAGVSEGKESWISAEIEER